MAFVVTDQGNALDTTLAGSVVKTISGGTIAVGSLVVVGVVDRAATSLGGVTDSKSNTYTLITSAHPNGLIANGLAGLFYSVLTTALTNGSDSITYTDGGLAGMSIISAIGNLASPLDTAITASATGTGTATSVTSGTPAVAGELMIEFVGTHGNTTIPADTTHGWALPPSVFGSALGVAGGGGNQVNVGTGTKIAAHTLGTTNPWAAFVVGFKPSSGNVFNVSITEAASAADAETVAAGFASAVTEAATAATTQTVTASFAAADTEAASATDSPSVIANFISAITEAANATDTESVIRNQFATITEAAVAVDLESATANYLAAIAEAASATEIESATAAFIASVIESAAATETEDCFNALGSQGTRGFIRDPWNRDSFGRFYPGSGMHQG